MVVMAVVVVVMVMGRVVVVVVVKGGKTSGGGVVEGWSEWVMEWWNGGVMKKWKSDWRMMGWWYSIHDRLRTKFSKALYRRLDYIRLNQWLQRNLLKTCSLMDLESSKWLALTEQRYSPESLSLISFRNNLRILVPSFSMNTRLPWFDR